MLNAEDIATIIVLVVLVAIFLTVFYFTYVSKVEDEIIRKQVAYLTNYFISDLKLLPREDIESIRQSIPDNQNMAEQDQAVKIHNKKVEEKAYTVLGIFSAIGIGIAYYLSKKYGFSLLDVLKNNLLILAFVALTEFIFLNVFVRNYISVDVNAIKLFILDKLVNRNQ